jgi:TPP-dependent indolepyruvate ferredoxin oxidoreductase alpha subunit
MTESDHLSHLTVNDLEVTFVPEGWIESSEPILCPDCPHQGQLGQARTRATLAYADR